MPMIDVYADSTLFAKESHGDDRRANRNRRGWSLRRAEPASRVAAPARLRFVVRTLAWGVGFDSDVPDSSGLTS